MNADPCGSGSTALVKKKSKKDDLADFPLIYFVSVLRCG